MAALGWLLNLDFAAGPSTAVAPTKRTGGSPSKQRRARRYPRRVSIDGRLVWVRSAEEERALLEQYRARLEAEAERLEAADAPAQTVARAKVRVIRVERRIAKVDNREAEWLARLQEEDEELLLVLH